MTRTHVVTMGEGGRLVLPRELRERIGLDAGRVLVVVEAEGGLVLLTRAQARVLVQADLADLDLVGDLFADRRRASSIDEQG